MTKNSEDIEKFVLANLKDQQECTLKISEQVKTIEKIVSILLKARDKNKLIYSMGNGGSGSTASHFVADLQKTSIIRDKKRIKAISLNDNIPVMLAWANDTSYSEIFVQQMKNFLSEGDVVIGFSGSGKSKNVVDALKYGKKEGAICIGFTGKSGGDLIKICDVCFRVPSNDMLTIETFHVMLCHCIISAIRNTGKPEFTYE